MYQKELIGLGETHKAISVMLEESAKDPRPVSIAIVDDMGELLFFVKKDGARTMNSQLAFKKAYTSSRMRTDSGAFALRLKEQGRSASDYGDPNLVNVQGGVCILKPGTQTCLGGIGVSGWAAPEDEALAKKGLEAMGLG